MSDITTQRFIDQLGFEHTCIVSGDDTRLIFCGDGLVARCFVVQEKIVVMLAGSEWIIETQQDLDRACTDIHTFIGNR